MDMAVEAFVALMVDELDKLLSKDAPLLGVNREINWIRVELNQMRRFLKDADIKQKEVEDVRDWMEDIRDICFDVDDVIDILGQGQAAQGRHGFVERLKRRISDQITRYKVGKEIERIKLSINGIKSRRESYGIREINKERPEAASSPQRLQGVRRCYVPPKKNESVITTVDDQLTNEERKRDIEEGRQEASSSSRNLQAHRRVSTLPGEPEEVGLPEEINIVGQQLIEEEPRPWDGTRDINEGKLEASSSTPGLKADMVFSTQLGDSEDFGLQEGINTVGQQLIKEEPGPYDGTRDINEGRQEASSWIRDLEGLRRDSVMFEEPQLVGQHEEFITVREQLMTEEQRRRVISIFGMGGSGKTALAKKILNDDHVKNYFDCHALVYVSQQCKIKDVLVRIIKGVAGDSAPEGMEKKDEVDLGLMLRDKYLRWKRYLVVIDDIWTREAWDSLILKLPDDGNESRVLVTTRIRDVALHADPSGHHHEMRLLNDDESWELFMKKIFPGKDPLTACPSELKEKGWKILKKCGGLPLAILVLGGLLAKRDKTLRAWSRVLESVNRHLSESPEQCMRILALSYWDLPPYLKPCFLYFGLFPEDYEISSGKMIRLWIAEGFIEQRDGQIMEDVAEDYLEELVSRSMIQVASRRSNGSIRKCRIHNLFRELSISAATEKNFFAHQDDNDTSSSSTSVRRLAVYCNIDGDETKNHSIESLRSIFYFFDSKVDVLKLPKRSRKLLRVMNVESEVRSEVSLPKKVGEFVHLKFLEFPGKYNLRSIPRSIGNLSSLQTLEVFGDSKMVNSPNTIWMLKELRHLKTNVYIKGPPHLSNLRNLQTLCLSAGSWIEEGLGKLTNLRKLSIYGTVSSYCDTLPYCIENLCNLRSLKLSGSGDLIPPFMPFTHHLFLYKITLGGRIEKLPEMPPNLVQLSLCHSELKQDAISTLEKLQHLKMLGLHVESYLSKQMICSPGGFPRLEFLELYYLPLEEWTVEEGAMISLKCVKLDGMSKLKTETLPERVRALLKYNNYSNEEEKRSINETGQEKTR